MKSIILPKRAAAIKAGHCEKRQYHILQGEKADDRKEVLFQSPGIQRNQKGQLFQSTFCKALPAKTAITRAVNLSGKRFLFPGKKFPEPADMKFTISRETALTGG